MNTRRASQRRAPVREQRTGHGPRIDSGRPHAEGRLKNQELGSDKHGRAFDSQGQGRHAYEKEHSPSAHLAEQFATQLSKILDQGRVENRYSKLVLVAEPQFLGNLRAALTPQTAALISASLDKDLGEVKERDLPTRLADIVGP